MVAWYWTRRHTHKQSSRNFCHSHTSFEQWWTMNNAFLHGAASVDRRIDNLTQLRSNSQKPNGSSGWIAASRIAVSVPLALLLWAFDFQLRKEWKIHNWNLAPAARNHCSLKVNHLTEVHSKWDLPYRKRQRRELQNKHQIGSPRFFPILSTEKRQGTWNSESITNDPNAHEARTA